MRTDLRAAAQAALDALMGVRRSDRSLESERLSAIDSLRAALAQPQAEPCGTCDGDGLVYEYAPGEGSRPCPTCKRAEPTGEWVMVPRVLTGGMDAAMMASVYDGGFTRIAGPRKVWDAALAAAPRAPARMLTDEEILDLWWSEGMPPATPTERNHATRAAIRAFAQANGIEVRDE